MAIWLVTCPNCSTANEVQRAQIVLECGKISCICICKNCKNEFRIEDQYWRWLGLDEAPPDLDKGIVTRIQS